MDSFSFMTGITMIQALVLIIGVILVIVEMFHPGFGAPGITGSALIIIGIILTAKTFLQAMILIALILAILGIALSLILHSATKGKLSDSPLILKQTNKKEAGYIGVEDLQFFLGKEGVSVTVLRPSGVVDFDGVKIDVVSEGAFIQPNTKVKVIKVDSRKIVVRELPA